MAYEKDSRVKGCYCDKYTDSEEESKSKGLEYSPGFIKCGACCIASDQADKEFEAEQAEEARMKGLNNGTIRPEVGMGATQTRPNIQYPFHIIKVSKTGKKITLQAAKATLIRAPKDFAIGGFAAHCSDNHAQEWKITPDPKGTIHTAQLTKRGWHSTTLGRVYVGAATRFDDYNL